MELQVYERLATAEDEHWWFVARRRILTDVLSRTLALPGRRRLLEAGCGTGGNLAMLGRFGEVCAFEPNEAARRMACAKSGLDVRPGSLPDDIPFAPGGFDLVAAFDVLEHLDDDVASLRALAAQLRPGGCALITVPALQFLWSAHDERHHHRRRYTRGGLLGRADAAGLAPITAGYFNTLLFPPIAAVRMAKTLFGSRDSDEAALPPRPLNRLLTAVFASERHLLGRVPLPLGVSLLLLARRRHP